MSTQHLRPFAAFVLVSVMCAVVMIRSINAADVNPVRPGGFAVVDGPRQVRASGASDLGQSEGPAITRVAAVSASRPSVASAPSPEPSTTNRSAGTSRPGSGDSAPSARPSAQPTGQPSEPSGQPGGKPTAGPTPVPEPSRAILRLKNLVANLAERSSQATGPERKRLLQRLTVLRLRLRVAELEAGITPEPPPAAPSPADPNPGVAVPDAGEPSNQAVVASEDPADEDQPQP